MTSTNTATFSGGDELAAIEASAKRGSPSRDDVPALDQPCHGGVLLQARQRPGSAWRWAGRVTASIHILWTVRRASPHPHHRVGTVTVGRCGPSIGRDKSGRKGDDDGAPVIGSKADGQRHAVAVFRGTGVNRQEDSDPASPIGRYEPRRLP
jgi:hypothetical protein